MNLDWQDPNYGRDEIDEEQFKYREKTWHSMLYDEIDNNLRDEADFD